MNDIFGLTERPEQDSFYKSSIPTDPRLGEIVSAETKDYDSAQVVILGIKTGDQPTADLIRRQFYRLTNFGINRKIVDLGNVNSAENYLKVTEKVLEDNKRLIVIGGGNEDLYAGSLAMSKVFGSDRWLGINIDSHLDLITEKQRSSKPVFQRLFEENQILPNYFYEIAFQPYFCSQQYFRFLQNKGVKMVSLEQLRSRETADLELRELIRQEFINHSRSMSILFNFSMNAVRGSDAPGVTNSSPFGLRAGEFLTLIQFGAKLVNTKFIQFSELNSGGDIEDRTAKLVAIGMHRFCSSLANI